MKLLSEILNQPYNFKYHGQQTDEYQAENHSYTFKTNSGNHYMVNARKEKYNATPSELSFAQVKNNAQMYKHMNSVKLDDMSFDHRDANKEKNPHRVYSTVAAIAKHHLETTNQKNGLSFNGFNKDQDRLYKKILKHHGIDFDDDNDQYSVKTSMKDKIK